MLQVDSLLLAYEGILHFIPPIKYFLPLNIRRSALRLICELNDGKNESQRVGTRNEANAQFFRESS